LLCSHQGWPLGEITEPKARSTWRCVLDSLLRRQPVIRYTGPRPADFRAIVLISPIWMYRLAGPMRSFIVNHKDALKKVAVIETMNAASAANAFTEIVHLLGHNLLDTAAFKAREIEDGSGTTRLLAFGDKLRTGAAASQRP
jgi:hypothetical protein